MAAPTQLFTWEVIDNAPIMQRSLNGTSTGRFVNFSINADGNFGINLNGSLAMVPQLAQVSAIIQGILGIFGLSQAGPEPEPQLKVITTGPGVSLATLFGASQGIAFLVQVLKGKIEQVKNYVTSAIQSISNLFECLLKNPLLAASIIAKLIRQGWIKMPPGVKEALEKVRDAINKVYGLNIIINNPIIDYIKKLKEWLQYKFPPAILLPFIPFIPGCSPGFYSGRPPAAVIGNDPITSQVTPQTVTIPGGFTSQLNIDVPKITLAFGPGSTPDLALTDDQVNNLLGGYNPYDLYTSGTIGKQFDENLNVSNYPLSTNTNSATRQVQDKLISASNKVSNDVTVLNKDISRAGYIPRPSPLDDLLCKPGER
jgi:hypothetical protein